MSLRIEAYDRGYRNTDLRSSTQADILPSAAISYWNPQDLRAHYVENGRGILVEMGGSFSANGTPPTLGDVSGDTWVMIRRVDSKLDLKKVWDQKDFDIKDLMTFNPAAELAALDQGVVFLGASAGWYDDEVQGGSGNDIFQGNGGWDSFYGNGGLDYAVFRGEFSEYTLARQPVYDYRLNDNQPNQSPNVDGMVVRDTVGNRDNRTDLVEVDRLQFNDINLALDTDGVAGQAYRLYKAAFNRQPDEGGLGYWIDQLDKGTGLRDVSYGFLASAEFISLYGNNVSNQEFINALYLNVLQRGADQSGFDYWENVLAQGYSRENILLDFSDSLENRVNVETLIANGIRYESWDPIVL